jgi:hypothetical protein
MEKQCTAHDSLLSVDDIVYEEETKKKTIFEITVFHFILLYYDKIKEYSVECT